MIIKEIENKNTFVIGDIHGYMENLYFHLEGDDTLVNSNIIIAGDIGLGFQKLEKDIQDYRKLNKLLKRKNVDLYLVRGNHDNPSYFSEHLITLSNVCTLEDYTILKCGNTNILCIGGGISIDRRNRIRYDEQRLLSYKKTHENESEEEVLRKAPKTYWVDEAPFFNEELIKEINETEFPIHYVITHTSPSFAYKNDTSGIEYFLVLDKELINDLENEREVFDKVYGELIKQGDALKEWVYGHFHGHYEEEINGVMFTALFNSDYRWDIKQLKLF